MKISELKLSSITLGKNASRIDLREKDVRELAKSIEAVGLLQPVIVREKARNSYELIAGFRRYTAMTRYLKKTSAPCVIFKKNADIKPELINMVENSMRKDPSEFEFGMLVLRLRNEGVPMERISLETGHSKSSLNDWMIAAERIPKEFQKKMVAPGVPNHKGILTPAVVLEIERASRTHAIKRTAVIALYRWALKNKVSSLNVRTVAKRVGLGMTVTQATGKQDLIKQTRAGFSLSPAQQKFIKEKTGCNALNEALRAVITAFVEGKLVSEQKVIVKKQGA